MSTPRAKKPSVRLSDDEVWATIEGSHTGILTTLRRDGTPIALPVWFVVLDRHIFVSTPSGSKKVGRVSRDPRASFLVESGERWAELKAIHLTGRIDIVDDDDVDTQIRQRMNDKYASFRTNRAKMPDATRQHYGVRSTLLRFVPDDRVLSWDNSKLPLG